LDYYPTASELLVTALNNVTPEKILVLIGGSSVFRGEGQNVNELWSEKLQENLGDQYKVLNFAFNGADVPSFGGVAYRILREHYPKIIFLTSCSFIEKSDLDGSDLYDFIFWDAYYKKLFHPSRSDKLKISKLRRRELHSSRGMEMHLMSYFDSLFYFKSLWNWIGYNYFFTVWNRNAQPNYFRAKKYFNDEPLDNKGDAEKRKNDSNFLQGEMNGLKNLVIPPFLTDIKSRGLSHQS
jgi:hypothetical protein